ncbi:TonB-dependent receptor [Dyadobacter tibetensis]|uniref:TonB-dependent receptor n=1 Tax=Dyadobacter tibetensis TaxID=1211851 RepID=UPI0004718D65|nr:TonB-dependent receptor [Dyadobacter tibetensis]
MYLSVRYLLPLFILTQFPFIGAYAQIDSLQGKDLEAITIRAFGSKTNMLEATATVGLIQNSTIERFPSTTWTSAVNSIPGLRMEERSPGSYRFSVRGSLIRSPFGVRNVKFYWNGIPFTDASGNTPLNALDFGGIDQMEVIKGPGSSLYGAGTGGVVLLHSSGELGKNSVSQSFDIGKYGFLRNSTAIKLGATTIQYGHTQQEGYRKHSAMSRDAIRVTSSFSAGNKGIMSLIGLYSDLHYQTPGGINLDQYRTDPTLARQPTNTLPGSESQKAGIYNKMVMLGLNYQLKLNDAWSQSNAFYLTYTDFENPFITNFEKRNEYGMGGRNIWQYEAPISTIKTSWTGGFEWQYGKSAQKNFDNKAGVIDQLQTAEDIGSSNLSAFVQAQLFFPENLNFQAGLSYNVNKYAYERLSPLPYTEEQKTFEGVFAPRLALNKVFYQNWSVTASYSEGFSPPTLQEVRPSAGGFRSGLNPEKGSNMEVSLRRIGKRLSAEINAYQFNLKETIVSRSDASGSEFFANAGKTNQKGLEWQLRYLLIDRAPFDITIWNNGNWTNYTFLDYQRGDANFDNNRLPGIPTLTVMTGLDALLPYGIQIFASHQYGGKVFLNDSNTAESTDYQQWIAKIVWKKTWNKNISSEISASGEKLFAGIYSLGYDYNAFGNRYYNAAPKTNFWAGAKLIWHWNKL